MAAPAVLALAEAPRLVEAPLTPAAGVADGPPRLCCWWRAKVRRRAMRLASRGRRRRRTSRRRRRRKPEAGRAAERKREPGTEAWRGRDRDAGRGSLGRGRRRAVVGGVGGHGGGLESVLEVDQSFRILRKTYSNGVVCQAIGFLAWYWWRSWSVAWRDRKGGRRGFFWCVATALTMLLRG